MFHPALLVSAAMTVFQGCDSCQKEKPIVRGIAAGSAILSSISHQPGGKKRNKEGLTSYKKIKKAGTQVKGDGMACAEMKERNPKNGY